MIFEISCWTLKKKKKKLSIFTFSKQSFLGILDFGAQNTPKLQKQFIKRPKSSNCLIIFHISSKKNPLVDVDLFSRTNDMELPSIGATIPINQEIQCLPYAGINHLQSSKTFMQRTSNRRFWRYNLTLPQEQMHITTKNLPTVIRPWQDVQKRLLQPEPVFVETTIALAAYPGCLALSRLMLDTYHWQLLLTSQNYWPQLSFMIGQLFTSDLHRYTTESQRKRYI